MSTPQLKIWQGQFGNEYMDRAKADVAARNMSFSSILKGLYVYRALEVGCGKGDNLVALKGLVEETYGLDPNDYAIDLAKRRGLWVQKGDCFKIPTPNMNFDLVLTAGVLMHVAPNDLSKAVTELCRVCRRYLLVIEYLAQTETLIDYRGNQNLLWKRDYRTILTQAPISTGFLGRGSGFDDCTYWLWDVIA